MSKKRNVTRGPLCKADDRLAEARACDGITPRSISETVRAAGEVQKGRYDRNEKVDDLYRRWSQTPPGVSGDRYETVLLHVYELYKPRIAAIARKYRGLNPIFDDHDLLQTGLLGILQALVTYDHSDDVIMRFSTYLEWSVRNIFQRSIGFRDKFVEVYDSDNGFLRIMSYQGFMAQKKAIVSKRLAYRIRSRECYLADVVASSDGPMTDGACLSPAINLCDDDEWLPPDDHDGASHG